MVFDEVCVVYLLRTGTAGDEVLLGEKLYGLGKGRLVGPGGKIESGETPTKAAVREVAEEVGLQVDPADLTVVGRLDYEFPDKPEWSQRSWVLTARRWTGEVRASDELVPRWVPVAEIPYDAMWSDAKLWLPSVLVGGNAVARAVFGSDNATVVSFGDVSE